MIKNIVLNTVAVGLVSSVLFIGCSNKAEVDMSKSESVYVDPEFKGAPEWVKVPFMEGVISDIGSAKPNAGDDFSFQREEAIADARNNLARQLSVKVSNMFKSFKAKTGSKESSTYDNSIESVSKQIASETLVGSKATKMWRSQTGTLYVFVELNTDSVKKEMEKSIKTSFKNDEAMYQKFLASKAQGELDKELESLNK